MEQEPARKRPGPKPGLAKRTNQLKVMLTDEEMTELVTKAMMSRMTYSDAVRVALQNWSPKAFHVAGRSHAQGDAGLGEE